MPFPVPGSRRLPLDEQSCHVLCGPGQIRLGMIGVKRLSKRACFRQYAENRVNSDSIQLIDTLPDIAGQCDHLAPRRHTFHSTGGAHRGFAVLRLRIDTTLPGNAVIRTVRLVVQSGGFNDDVHSRTHRGIGEGQETRTQAARGPRPRGCGRHRGRAVC